MRVIHSIGSLHHAHGDSVTEERYRIIIIRRSCWVRLPHFPVSGVVNPCRDVNLSSHNSGEI